MSMRDYAVNDYGLLITEDTIKLLASKLCEDYSDEAYIADEWGFKDELINKDFVYYLSDFTGEANPIDDDGCVLWGHAGEHTLYSNETIFYIPLMNYPLLFTAAYNNMDEIVEEMKETVGKYLPDDFDYRGNLMYICGTYFG